MTVQLVAEAPAGEHLRDREVHGWRMGDVHGLTLVVKTVLEAALEAEIVEHLGYPKYDSTGRQAGSNSRNGTRLKTVATRFGPIQVDVPRDRWGTFQPVTVGKWQRRAAGLDHLVLASAAKGAPHDETVQLLSWVYRGVTRRKLLNEIATTVRKRMAPWHERPLRPVYDCVLVDRVVVRLRHYDVSSRPIHTALGVTGEGQRELLGLWIANEQTAAELGEEIAADLKARGVDNVTPGPGS